MRGEGYEHGAQRPRVGRGLGQVGVQQVGRGRVRIRVDGRGVQGRAGPVPVRVPA